MCGNWPVAVARHRVISGGVSVVSPTPSCNYDRDNNDEIPSIERDIVTKSLLDWRRPPRKKQEKMFQVGTQHQERWNTEEEYSSKWLDAKKRPGLEAWSMQLLIEVIIIIIVYWSVLVGMMGRSPSFTSFVTHQKKTFGDGHLIFDFRFSSWWFFDLLWQSRHAATTSIIKPNRVSKQTRNFPSSIDPPQRVFEISLDSSSAWNGQIIRILNEDDNHLGNFPTSTGN